MKRKILSCLLFLSLLFCCTACNSEENDYRNLSYDAALTFLSKEPKAVIMDVRTALEYQGEHIKDAISFPLEQLEENALLKAGFRKDTPILVYCRTGSRSKIAALRLIELGYTSVYDLGGILDWPGEIIQS